MKFVVLLHIIDQHEQLYSFQLLYYGLVSLQNVYFLLKQFHEDYSEGIIPHLKDSFTRNLFLNNGASLSSTDQFVANGISLALKNSANIDDAMLSWLGANSTYLSALKDDRVRTYVKKYWQENFESIQNLTTNNDMPIQMSVLQALTDVVRTAPIFTQRDDTQEFEGGA